MPSVVPLLEVPSESLLSLLYLIVKFPAAKKVRSFKFGIRREKAKREGDWIFIVTDWQPCSLLSCAGQSRG